ncbi:unnamed protein product [Amoebophrya sp. A120]|nr:unnamed protein product [Amoebophrya sp. A120]|eukprot:GSA120T00019329001.1
MTSSFPKELSPRSRPLLDPNHAADEDQTAPAARTDSAPHTPSSRPKTIKKQLTWDLGQAIQERQQAAMSNSSSHGGGAGVAAAASSGQTLTAGGGARSSTSGGVFKSSSSSTSRSSTFNPMIPPPLNLAGGQDYQQWKAKNTNSTRKNKAGSTAAGAAAASSQSKVWDNKSQNHNYREMMKRKTTRSSSSLHIGEEDEYYQDQQTSLFNLAQRRSLTTSDFMNNRSYNNQQDQGRTNGLEPGALSSQAEPQPGRGGARRVSQVWKDIQRTLYTAAGFAKAGKDRAFRRREEELRDQYYRQLKDSEENLSAGGSRDRGLDSGNTSSPLFPQKMKDLTMPSITSAFKKRKQFGKRHQSSLEERPLRGSTPSAFLPEPTNGLGFLPWEMRATAVSFADLPTEDRYVQYVDGRSDLHFQIDMGNPYEGTAFMTELLPEEKLSHKQTTFVGVAYQITSLGNLNTTLEEVSLGFELSMFFKIKDEDASFFKERIGPEVRFHDFEGKMPCFRLLSVPEEPEVVSENIVAVRRCFDRDVELLEHESDSEEEGENSDESDDDSDEAGVPFGEGDASFWDYYNKKRPAVPHEKSNSTEDIINYTTEGETQAGGATTSCTSDSDSKNRIPTLEPSSSLDSSKERKKNAANKQGRSSKTAGTAPPFGGAGAYYSKSSSQEQILNAIKHNKVVKQAKSRFKSKHTWKKQHVEPPPLAYYVQVYGKYRCTCRQVMDLVHFPFSRQLIRLSFVATANTYKYIFVPWAYMLPFYELVEEDVEEDCEQDSFSRFVQKLSDYQKSQRFTRSSNGRTSTSRDNSLRQGGGSRRDSTSVSTTNNIKQGGGRDIDQRTRTNATLVEGVSNTDSLGRGEEHVVKDLLSDHHVAENSTSTKGEQSSASYENLERASTYDLRPEIRSSEADRQLHEGSGKEVRFSGASSSTSNFFEGLIPEDDEDFARLLDDEKNSTTLSRKSCGFARDVFIPDMEEPSCGSAAPENGTGFGFDDDYGSVSSSDGDEGFLDYDLLVEGRQKEGFTNSIRSYSVPASSSSRRSGFAGGGVGNNIKTKILERNDTRTTVRPRFQPEGEVASMVIPEEGEEDAVLDAETDGRGQNFYSGGVVDHDNPAPEGQYKATSNKTYRRSSSLPDRANRNSRTAYDLPGREIMSAAKRRSIQLSRGEFIKKRAKSDWRQMLLQPGSGLSDQEKTPVTNYRSTTSTGPGSAAGGATSPPPQVNTSATSSLTNQANPPKKNYRLVELRLRPSVFKGRCRMSESWICRCHFSEFYPLSWLASMPSGAKYSRFHIVLQMECVPTFYLLNVHFILLCLVSLSFSTFLIDPDDPGSRMQVLLTLILSLAAYKVTLNTWTPIKPYVTRLDVYVLVTFLITSIMGLDCMLAALTCNLFPSTKDTVIWIEAIVWIPVFFAWVILHYFVFKSEFLANGQYGTLVYPKWADVLKIDDANQQAESEFVESMNRRGFQMDRANLPSVATMTKKLARYYRNHGEFL